MDNIASGMSAFLDDHFVRQVRFPMTELFVNYTSVRAVMKSIASLILLIAAVCMTGKS